MGHRGRRPCPGDGGHAVRRRTAQRPGYGEGHPARAGPPARAIRAPPGARAGVELRRSPQGSGSTEGAAGVPEAALVRHRSRGVHRAATRRGGGSVSTAWRPRCSRSTAAWRPRSRPRRSASRPSAPGWKRSTKSAPFWPRPTPLTSCRAASAQRVRTVMKADAVAVRWSDEANQRYLMLASDCFPQDMVEEERSLLAGACACGNLQADARTRVIPILTHDAQPVRHCARAGYESLVSVPIRLQQRLIGEIDLFFRRPVTLERRGNRVARRAGQPPGQRAGGPARGGAGARGRGGRGACPAGA